MPPTTQGSRAVGFALYRAARIPAEPPAWPTGWGAYAASTALLPGSVEEAAAPAYARAKCEVNLAAAGQWPWDWPGLAGFDDRILIATVNDVPADALILFEGFLQEGDWHFDRTGGAVATACSNAFRLLRDVLVYGRWMVCGDGEVRLFSGLPCVFNARGKPNRWPTLKVVTGEDVLLPREACPVFAGDDAPGAVYWTALDAFEYLMARYNRLQTWIANNFFTVELHEASETLPATAAEGMNMWAALAAVGEAAGFDVFERFTNITDEEEIPVARSVIKILSRWPGLGRPTGDQKSVKHQVPSGTVLAQLDLAQTNLFSASVAESITSSITAPVVAGGSQILELSILLGRAWDGEKLEIPQNEQAMPTSMGLEKDSVYYSRYCTDGKDFAGYRDVGRLWDANTDGKYDLAPWGLERVNLDSLVGEEEGTWPVMACKPLPCLTRLAQIAGPLKEGVSGEVFAEYSIDSGALWRPLPGYQVLPDRIGIRITQANLADIYPEYSTDPVADNLFAMLANVDPSLVLVRLTCSVASPHRNKAAPEVRATAATKFATGEYFDRGAYAQRRTVTESSKFYQGGYRTDEVSIEEAEGLINAQASAIQDAAEDRLIEASLPIEWPDEPLHLGDLITQIEGIGIDLGSILGEEHRYPRVIARTLLLTPQTYAMVLILNTYRKAAAV